MIRRDVIAPFKKGTNKIILFDWLCDVITTSTYGRANATANAIASSFYRYKIAVTRQSVFSERNDKVPLLGSPEADQGQRSGVRQASSDDVASAADDVTGLSRPQSLDDRGVGPDVQRDVVWSLPAEAEEALGCQLGSFWHKVSQILKVSHVDHDELKPSAQARLAVANSPFTLLMNAQNKHQLRKQMHPTSADTAYMLHLLGVLHDTVTKPPKINLD
ncbi:hypothetical protein F2P81_001597 [Scophthalmus maximus]|uniref:Uncharacterized protein n=1 Tax=Scophthalmus maximus TaxID=52904 RepID=A0A6A4TKQ5_SCOMX|nr:hypothetical protein F2P81_001597 [Scophthalmus maximus]